MRDELETLPGIGPSLAADLRQLGVKSIADLAGRDPETLYARLCDLTHEKQDPCVLYTFRCAVYASRTAMPEPHLLKWWERTERRFDDKGRVNATAKGVPDKYARVRKPTRFAPSKLRVRKPAPAP
jgi:hypothetical protein